MKRQISLILLLLSAGPAAADWVFRPSQASDDLGSAYVRDATGITFDIGCGNGGEISIDIRPDPSKKGDGRDLALEFPGERGVISLPMECASGVCSSGWQYANGQTWTPKQRAYLIATLRREPTMTLHELGTRDSKIADFTLKGSSAALSKLKQSSSCEGL